MNEELEINVRKLRPFTRFIYTIGELPTSYLMSMTYEEQLIWFCNYLEKTVIPTVNNNAEAIIELQEYIKNLDLQDEVNNKLDEMAEDGTLENLIGQYIQLATTYVYNSVADLKTANNLIDGSYARTSGFYTYNDGGGAYYKVRTLINTDVVDEITLIALNDPTLVAELIQKDVMSVKMFGAKGDGETDDTTPIQKAFNYCHNILIKDGVYMVNAITGVTPQDNSYIKLVNATLKAITNSSTNYHVLFINNNTNIIVEGGIIAGERSTHTGETGEWGHCVTIANSSNITLKNMILKDAWGDGLYINRGVNINTQNLICDNNRRQGISVIRVDGYHSLNDKLINTNGTAPESGIDIEPNTSADFIKNVILENLYTENNNGCGVDIHLATLDSTSDPVSIKVINHHDKGSITGEKITHPATIRHSIITENALLENNNTGINLRDCFDNEIDKVLIIKPKIINCNYDTSITAAYVCGIGCYTTNGDTTDKLGGVSIIEPFITSMIQTNRRGITFYDTTNTNRCNNIDIINPLNKQANLSLAIYGDNIKFTDIYEKYKYKGNYSMNIQSSELYSIFSNINFTSSRTLTLYETLPIGYKVSFINEKLNYRISIQMPANDYIRYFNTSTGNKINLDSMNSLITMEKIADHEWIVTNLIGTVNIATE